jgi:hypothetical protein
MPALKLADCDFHGYVEELVRRQAQHAAQLCDRVIA